MWPVHAMAAKAWGKGVSAPCSFSVGREGGKAVPPSYLGVAQNKKIIWTLSRK